MQTSYVHAPYVWGLCRPRARRPDTAKSIPRPRRRGRRRFGGVSGVSKMDLCIVVADLWVILKGIECHFSLRGIAGDSMFTIIWGCLLVA